MAKKQSEVVQFNCRMSKEMLKDFEATKPKGFTSQTLGNCLVRLWNSLSPEIRVELLIAETMLEVNPNASSDSLVTIVKRIAEDVYQQQSKRKEHTGSKRS